MEIYIDEISKNMIRLSWTLVEFLVYDINYIKWSIIIDNNLYLTDGAGVKSIDIVSGCVDTIYRVKGKHGQWGNVNMSVF